MVGYDGSAPSKVSGRRSNMPGRYTFSRQVLLEIKTICNIKDLTTRDVARSMMSTAGLHIYSL